jgi:hypothetical protein
MEDGVDTLGRWMAHHLAELLTEAEHAKGSRGREVKESVADLILKIWDRRRLLQSRVDPLATYKKGAEVLAAINASAGAFSNWAPARAPTQASLSLDIYALASRLALLGVVETLPKSPGAIHPVVESMLAPAEREFLGAAQAIGHFAGSGAGEATTPAAAKAAVTDTVAIRTALLKKITATAASLLALSADAARDSSVPAKKRRLAPVKSKRGATASPARRTSRT